MATTILKPIQAAAGHFLLLSCSFLVLMTSSSSCFSVYAFASNISLRRGSINHLPSYCPRNSRIRRTSMAYTSTPFDVEVDTNDDLWQLLQQLRHTNRNAENQSGEEAFQRVIETLYNESQLNIHNLEQEIEVLRQTLDASTLDDGSCNGSFQPMTQDDDDNNNNSKCTNTHADEISSELLKAVFVGYYWTEDDRKRLASAHPQDRPL
mmetsp:Transcript_4398/g.7249  ORF Transcript_4398/g.7249 Transcript_4398/m.7249 type:complete len:208 (+) Transcript_4398:121-744(+)